MVDLGPDDPGRGIAAGFHSWIAAQEAPGRPGAALRSLCR